MNRQNQVELNDFDVLSNKKWRVDHICWNMLDYNPIPTWYFCSFGGVAASYSLYEASGQVSRLYFAWKSASLRRMNRHLRVEWNFSRILLIIQVWLSFIPRGRDQNHIETIVNNISHVQDINYYSKVLPSRV